MASRRSDPEHAAHGSALARLIYAWRQSDGAYVRVTDVPSGLDEDLRCPAPSCRAPLVARKGRSGRTEHFAHHAGRARICEAGRETSAHLLAKDILAEQLWLWLPPVVAEFDGERIEVAPARKLVFGKAVLEDRLGDLIPDVVLHLGDRRLLVEVRVTHGCDDAKIAKLKARALPTVEIDIRKAQHGSHEAITAAILETGKREWLHNARQDDALATLRARSAERNRAATDALRARARGIAGTAADPASTPEGQAALRRLDDLDLAATLLRPDLATRVFRVPDAEWQALVAGRVLIADYADDLDGSFGVGHIFRWACGAGLIRDGLAPQWDAGLLEAVLAEDPGFRTATASLLQYLKSLETTGLLEVAGKQRWRRAEAFRRDIKGRLEAVRERSERRTTAQQMVKSLLAIAADESEGFDFEAWASNRIPPFGADLEAIIRSDDWRRLHVGLRDLPWTLRYGAETAPDATFGLPVEKTLRSALEGFQHRKLEAEQARLDARQKAAEARLDAVRRAFAQVMPGDAVESCLDGRFKDREETIRAEALGGDEGRDRALNWAAARFRQQTRQQRDKDIAAEYRARLETAAIGRLDAQKGRLWCATANGALGGQRPQAYCISENALKRCLAVLDDQAKGIGRRR